MAPRRGGKEVQGGTRRYKEIQEIQEIHGTGGTGDAVGTGGTGDGGTGGCKVVFAEPRPKRQKILSCS